MLDSAEDRRIKRDFRDAFYIEEADRESQVWERGRDFIEITHHGVSTE